MNKKRKSSIKETKIINEPNIFQIESDSIAYSMVNKIISLSFTRAFKEKVEKKISNEIYYNIK